MKPMTWMHIELINTAPIKRF